MTTHIFDSTKRDKLARVTRYQHKHYLQQNIKPIWRRWSSSV